MSLDDRDLREHLDRRASAGSLDPSAIADAVATRLPERNRPWWGALGQWRRTLAPVVATAAIVAVLGVALFPRVLGDGPGVSPPPTATPLAVGYPADRPLTLEELDQVLNWDDRPDEVVVVADVELTESSVACMADQVCAVFDLAMPGASEPIHVWYWTGDQLQVGPYAFRIRTPSVTGDSGLDVLGSVRPDDARLAWSLPGFIDELAAIKGAGVFPVGRLYLVDAVRAIAETMPPCPTSDADPEFACGAGMAWLVADESAVAEVPSGLRIPNVEIVDAVPGAYREHGFWLIDPSIDVAQCFGCTTDGAVDLLGRVVTLAELGLGPTGPTAEPTIAPTPTVEPTPAGPRPEVTDIAFSVDSLTLDGLETADIEVTVTFDREVVETGQMDMSLTPLVCLQRAGNDDDVSSAVTQMADNLSPTGELNTWSTTFRFVSSQHGTWWVSCLQAYDAHGVAMTDDMIGIDPQALGLSPTLEVVGTHRPQLTMLFKPQPATIGQQLEVYGQVTDENGTPFPGIEVTIGRDNVCAEGGGGDVVTADEQGRYTYVIEQLDPYAICAWLLEVPGVWPNPFFGGDPVGLFGARFQHPEIAE